MTQLIVIGGFAGAGKSTLARRLGQTLAIPVFEIDQLARSIQNSPDFQGSSRQAYGISFDLFFTFARSHLGNGNSLILDQNMGHPMTWGNLNQLRTAMPDRQVIIFLLMCPYDVCCARVAARTEHPNQTEITVDDLADHKHKWDYLNDNDLPEAIRIDATQPAEAVFQDVMSYLADKLTSEAC